MTDPARVPLQLDPPVATFLARHGHAGAALDALRGDASARRYLRLRGKGLLLMEDRSDPASFAAYLRIARHLAALGLSAPRLIGADPAVGLALIEDFGDATYGRLLQSGADERALYALAVDTLLHLHRAPDAAQVAVPAYDTRTLLDEIGIFADWFAPHVRPDIDRAAFKARCAALWEPALAPLNLVPQTPVPQTLVLRDFHVDNLMLLQDRHGVRQCGLLDFQDALRGPAAYDLVSLLQDARRDLAPGLEAEMRARYIAGAPAGAGSAITRDYHLLGAQRHMRIAGVFLRLARRDHKPGYLQFLPRVLRQMDAALTAAGLHAITDHLDTQLPGWRMAHHALAQPA